MKILVLGSNGQLGCCLFDQLQYAEYEVIFMPRTEIDICDLESTKDSISNINPDVIINAAAYTAVDMAENDEKKADLINHLAVASIAATCVKLDCWLIHISTDYVFDGLAVLPYKETDATNPKSIYGSSKLNGELKVRSSGCKYVIIRTAWVFSEYGSNFMKTMLRLGAERKKMSIVVDQVGCPTYTQDLAKAIVSVIWQLRLDQILSGVYHYSGDKMCSWHEFANVIFFEAKKIGYSVPDSIIPITTDQYPMPASRPAYSVLDSSKFESEFGLTPSNWRNAIKKVLLALGSPL